MIQYREGLLIPLWDDEKLDMECLDWDSIKGPRPGRTRICFDTRGKMILICAGNGQAESMALYELVGGRK